MKKGAQIGNKAGRQSALQENVVEGSGGRSHVIINSGFGKIKQQKKQKLIQRGLQNGTSYIQGQSLRSSMKSGEIETERHVSGLSLPMAVGQQQIGINSRQKVSIKVKNKDLIEKRSVDRFANQMDKHMQINLKTPEETKNTDSILNQPQKKSVSCQSSGGSMIEVSEQQIKNQMVKKVVLLKEGKDIQDQNMNSGESSKIIADRSKNIQIIDQTKSQKKEVKDACASNKSEIDYFDPKTQSKMLLPKVNIQHVSPMSKNEWNRTANNSKSTFVNQKSMSTHPSNDPRFNLHSKTHLNRYRENGMMFNKKQELANCSQEYFTFQGNTVMERVNSGHLKLSPNMRNSMFENSFQVGNTGQAGASAMSNVGRDARAQNNDLIPDLNKDSSMRYEKGRESSLISVIEWNKLNNQGSDDNFKNIFKQNRSKVEMMNQTMKVFNPLNVSSRQDIGRYQESDTVLTKAHNNFSKDGLDGFATLKYSSYSKDLNVTNESFHSKMIGKITGPDESDANNIGRNNRHLRNSTNFSMISKDKFKEKLISARERAQNLRKSFMSPELKSNPMMDLDEIKNKKKVQHLPKILDAKPVEQKQLKPAIEFRLPSQYKYTNNAELANVETIRQKIRLNRIKHKDYDQSQNSVQGRIYHENVYIPGAPTYCTISPADIPKRNKMLGYTKPVAKIGETERHELDQSKMKAYLNCKIDGQRIASPELSDNELKGKEVITNKDIELMNETDGHRKVKADLEKDLYALLLKFRKELKEDAEKKQKKKVRGSSLQKKLAELQSIQNSKSRKNEGKVDEASQWKVQVKEWNDKLQTENMFEQFNQNLQMIENGEFKVDLFKSKRIERMIKDEGLLSKCEPLNFHGSLQHFVKEISEMLDKGFEIDKDEMKKIIQQCNQKIKELSKIDSEAYLREKRRKEKKFTKSSLRLSPMNSSIQRQQTFVSPFGLSPNQKSPFGLSPNQSPPFGSQESMSKGERSPKRSFERSVTFKEPQVNSEKKDKQEQLFEEVFQNQMSKLKLSEMEQNHIRDKRTYLINCQRLLIEQGVDRNTIGYVDPDAELSLAEIEMGLQMLNSTSIQTKLNQIKNQQENLKKVRMKKKTMGTYHSIARKKKIEEYNRKLQEQQQQIIESIKKIHIKYDHRKRDESSTSSEEFEEQEPDQNKDLYDSSQPKEAQVFTRASEEKRDEILGEDEEVENQSQVKEGDSIIEKWQMSVASASQGKKSEMRQSVIADVIVEDHKQNQNVTVEDHGQDDSGSQTKQSFKGCVIEPTRNTEERLRLHTHDSQVVTSPSKREDEVVVLDEDTEYDRMHIKTENSSQPEKEGADEPMYQHQQIVLDANKFFKEEAQNVADNLARPNMNLIPMSDIARNTYMAGSWSSTDGGNRGIFGVKLSEQDKEEIIDQSPYPRHTKTSLMRQEANDSLQRQLERDEDKTRIHANQYEMMRLKYKLDHEKAKHSENLRNNVLRNKQIISQMSQYSGKKAVVQNGKLLYVDQSEFSSPKANLFPRDNFNQQMITLSIGKSAKKKDVKGKLSTLQQTVSKMQLENSPSKSKLKQDSKEKKKQKSSKEFDGSGFIPDAEYEKEEIGDSPLKSGVSSETEDWNVKNVGYKSLSKPSPENFKQNLNFFDKNYQKIDKMDSVDIIFDDSINQQILLEEEAQKQIDHQPVSNIRKIVKAQEFKEFIEQRRKLLRQYNMLNKKLKKKQSKRELFEES